MFPSGYYLMRRIVRTGPAEPELEPDAIESGRPKNPVRAVPES
jgi:hypothetical protein